MTASVSIDPELIELALELSGERTKRAAVTKALEEFITQAGALLDLMGKLDWESSHDSKAERSRK
jgi:putative antitoxin of VapBC-like toxin-antitoxin system